MLSNPLIYRCQQSLHYMLMVMVLCFSSLDRLLAQDDLLCTYSRTYPFNEVDDNKLIVHIHTDGLIRVHYPLGMKRAGDYARYLTETEILLVDSTMESLRNARAQEIRTTNLHSIPENTQAESINDSTIYHHVESDRSPVNVTIYGDQPFEVNFLHTAFLPKTRTVNTFKSEQNRIDEMLYQLAKSTGVSANRIDKFVTAVE